MYRVIGITATQPIEWLPTDCAILVKMGEQLEPAISDAIDALGRPNTRLSLLTLETLFTINTKAFAAGTPERQRLLRVLAFMLKHAGYLSSDTPVFINHENPIVEIDELCRLSLASKLTHMSAEDLGGQYATLMNLKAALLFHIKRYAFIEDEVAPRVRHFRDAIRNIGYKVNTGVQLTQAEKTVFAVYRSTEQGSPGRSALADNTRLYAEQIENPLVTQAWAECMASAAPGPFWNFIQLVSDKSPEHLSFMFGIYPTSADLFVGRMRQWGPFQAPNFERVDSIAWSIGQQFIGLSDRLDYFTIPQSTLLGVAVQPAVMHSDLSEMGGSIPLDAPDISWRLEKDETGRYPLDQAIWSYFSKWRSRVINSTARSGALVEDYLIDVALATESVGSTQLGVLNPATLGLGDYAQIQDMFIRVSNEQLMTTVYIPRAGTRVLVPEKVDMSDYYVTRGSYLVRSALANKIRVPKSWFNQPDENAVNYISSRLSLTVDQKVRLAPILTIAHNAGRFTRLTGNTPDFDVRLYCAAVGNYDMAATVTV